MTDKETYQNDMERKLKEWKADLDTISAEAKQLGEDSQKQTENEIEGLRDEVWDVQNRLKELASAAESKWESLKSDLDARWSKLRKRMEAIASKVGK